MSARKVILLLPLLFFYTSIQIYAQDYIPVVLQWEPVDGADGYRLYYGTDSRHNPENIHPYNGTEAKKEDIKDDSPIDVGNVTQFTVQIPDDEAYFFAVTTVDNDQDYPYSDFSNEEATLCITWPTGGFYVNEENDSPYRVWGRADESNEVQLSANGTPLGIATADQNRDWWIDVDFEQQFSEGAVSLVVESSGITAPAVTAIYDMSKPVSSANNVQSMSGTLYIAWTASDATSGVASTELWCKPPGGTWASTGHTRPWTSGTFYYRPPDGDDGIYYFATQSVDRAGNWEAEPNGDGDTSIQYTAPVDPAAEPPGSLTGIEAAAGCFISTAAPGLFSEQ